MRVMIAVCCLASATGAAFADGRGVRTVGEVKCDVDGDGDDETIRLTIDDKDHSQIAVAKGDKLAGEVAGPSAPHGLEARQVVRDKACEIAVTSDGSVKLALFKWKKEGAFKKDHFARVAELPEIKFTTEQAGDKDVVAVGAQTVWMWNADKFTFDGPISQERCDLDGDGQPDSVRLADTLVAVVAGKAVTAAPRAGAQLSIKQLVRDKACEVVLTAKDGIDVYKWNLGGLVRVLTLAGDKLTPKKDLLVAADGSTWKWNDKRFAFRLKSGKPATLCDAAKPMCPAGSSCDPSLVEQKKPKQGLCVPR